MQQRWREVDEHFVALLRRPGELAPDAETVELVATSLLERGDMQGASVAVTAARAAGAPLSGAVCEVHLAALQALGDWEGAWAALQVAEQSGFATVSMVQV